VQKGVFRKFGCGEADPALSDSGYDEVRIHNTGTFPIRTAGADRSAGTETSRISVAGNPSGGRAAEDAKTGDTVKAAPIHIALSVAPKKRMQMRKRPDLVRPIQENNYLNQSLVVIQVGPSAH
jgi:hypothetical protein